MGKGSFIFGGILLVLIIAFGYLFVAGISETKVDSFELRNIRNIDGGGFTFDAILGIYNPSNAIVPILSLNYTATLERTNREISTGSFESFTLDPRGVTELPFEARISWVPTANTLTDIATEKEVWMRVDGIAIIGTEDIGKTLAFSDRIDIASYIRRFAPAAPSIVRDSTQDITDSTLKESEDANVLGETSLLN